MDRKFRARRSLLGRERGRRRATIALLCLLAIAGLGLFLWFRTSEVFAVEKVVVSGIVRVSLEELKQVLAMTKGKNLFCLSTRELGETLEALPYVREAAVWRRFPDALEVHISEYEPVARIQVANGTCWLAGEDGRILEKAIPPRGINLPLIVVPSLDAVTAGQRLPAPLVAAIGVVSDLKTSPFGEFFSQVARVEVALDGAVTVILKTQTEVRLGQPTDLERKLKVAARVLESNLRLGKELEYVDVAVPDRVVAKPR